MAKNKRKQPHDTRGGFLMIPAPLIKSKNYQSLYSYAQRLMIFMQIHWSGIKPVSFSVREAEKLLNCDRRTAMRAFKELQERGFIVKVDESVFCSRSQSRARTWRLTWMPYNWCEPTREWESWEEK